MMEVAQAGKWLFRHLVLAISGLGIFSFLGGAIAFAWTKSLQIALRWLWLAPTALLGMVVVVGAIVFFLEVADPVSMFFELLTHGYDRKPRQRPSP